MNAYTLCTENKILNSHEAEEGAKHLFDKIERGILTMDILPNNYEKFSGRLEEEDYISYCRFIKSANGKKVLSMLEEQDARDLVKL